VRWTIVASLWDTHRANGNHITCEISAETLKVSFQPATFTSVVVRRCEASIFADRQTAVCTDRPLAGFIGVQSHYHHHVKTSNDAPADCRRPPERPNHILLGTAKDWLVEQGLTSPPTQYRLYGRRGTAKEDLKQDLLCNLQLLTPCHDFLLFYIKT